MQGKAKNEDQEEVRAGMAEVTKQRHWRRTFLKLSVQCMEKVGGEQARLQETTA